MSDADSVCSATCAESLEDVADVCFRRPYGDIELRADFLVGKAVGDKGEHFELPFAQRFDLASRIRAGTPSRIQR